MAKKKTNKKKLINSMVSSMAKTFGAGAAEVVFKSPPKLWLPSKNLATNVIISNGRGLPFGRMVEGWGESSSGKSIFLLDLFAQVQKMGGIGIYADPEESLDPNWAIRNKIDPELLLMLKCATVEEFFSRLFGEGKKKGLIQKIRAKDPDSPILTGLDSLAALSTEVELASEFGKQDFTKARWVSQAMRKVVEMCDRYGVLLVILNQVREKVMVMYGDKETTPGGRAVRFFSAISLRFKTKRKLLLDVKDSKEKRIIGVRSKIFVQKNRVARPFGEAFINILFDQGMTVYSGLLAVLLKSGIVKRKPRGSTYHWGKYKFTKKNFKKFIQKHPEILQSMPEEILEGDSRYENIKDEED
jgi:recombination protein RecA